MSRETFDWERRMQPFMDFWYIEELNKNVVNRKESCKKYDVIVDDLKIEEKFLFTDYDYPQMLVEIIQDVESWNLGWFHHVEADYLVWAFCPKDHVSRPRTIYMIKYRRFVEYIIKLLKNANMWERFNINNKYYGITINFPVEFEPLVNENIAVKYTFTLKELL